MTLVDRFARCALIAMLPMAGSMSATTLEKLTLDDMIQKSTEIVRGHVQAVNAVQRGALIYTQAQVKVIERWKGADAPTVTVWIPGGAVNGLRQRISGSPQVVSGGEYVFFLWTGPKKVTQIIGLSQGLLNLQTDPKGGTARVRRAVITDAVVDSDGQPAHADEIDMSLVELRTRVIQQTGGARQ